jgi:hypothetical protein
MINKTDNIYTHPYLKRVVEHKGEQINFLDQRFYKTEDGQYYPSVTSVLNYYPKNKFFENWLKDVSHNSEIIVKKAKGRACRVNSPAIPELKNPKT